MIKISMLLTVIALAGCPAHTDTAATLKQLGVSELNCGKAAVANEMPTVTDAVGALLAANTPNSQSLLDALFRQAPELIACTVHSLVGAVTHPVVGARMAAAVVANQAAVAKNGNDALSRWGVK